MGTKGTGIDLEFFFVVFDLIVAFVVRTQ